MLVKPPKEMDRDVWAENLPYRCMEQAAPALRISPAAGKEDKGDHGYRQWSLYLHKLLR